MLKHINIVLIAVMLLANNEIISLAIWAYWAMKGAIKIVSIALDADHREGWHES